jgi:hypothetical protein
MARKGYEYIPSFAKRKRDPLHLVVEGAGAVVGDKYLKALPELKKYLSPRQLRVTFADATRPWREKDNPALTRSREGIIAKIRENGFDYLDKSNGDDFEKWKTLEGGRRDCCHTGSSSCQRRARLDQPQTAPRADLYRKAP